MPTYRLGEGANAQGWPYLRGGHAYLADGMPLTEADPYGRVKPAQATLAKSKATCAGGLIGLPDRQNGIEALARALDKGDAVRASLLLLFLQIDPPVTVVKYNPYHRPPGPGGGQFTSGSQSGRSSPRDPGFQHVGQTLNVAVNSTYEYGKYGPEIDAAHKQALLMVYIATTAVGRLGFRPGMPDYGTELDLALTLLVKTGDFPGFSAQPVFLNGKLQRGGTRPPGSSAPDLVYGPEGHPLIIFELKSGRPALDLSDAEIVEQKRRTLINVPGNPVYQYFQVYDKP